MKADAQFKLGLKSMIDTLRCGLQRIQSLAENFLHMGYKIWNIPKISILKTVIYFLAGHFRFLVRRLSPLVWFTSRVTVSLVFSIFWNFCGFNNFQVEGEVVTSEFILIRSHIKWSPCRLLGGLTKLGCSKERVLTRILNTPLNICEIKLMINHQSATQCIADNLFLVFVKCGHSFQVVG